MKKVFAILAVVAFVACNSGENQEAAADTTATVDTAVVFVIKHILLARRSSRQSREDFFLCQFVPVSYDCTSLASILFSSMCNRLETGLRPVVTI